METSSCIRSRSTSRTPSKFWLQCNHQRTADISLTRSSFVIWFGNIDWWCVFDVMTRLHFVSLAINMAVIRISMLQGLSVWPAHLTWMWAQDWCKLFVIFQCSITKYLCATLQVIGISFHVGSGCNDVTAFTRAIEHARKLFDFAETVGFEFNFLDIGGGFAGFEGDGITSMEQVSVQNSENTFENKRNGSGGPMIWADWLIRMKWCSHRFQQASTKL